MSFLDGQSEALAQTKGMYNLQLMIVDAGDPITDAALTNMAQGIESAAVPATANAAPE